MEEGPGVAKAIGREEGGGERGVGRMMRKRMLWQGTPNSARNSALCATARNLRFYHGVCTFDDLYFLKSENWAVRERGVG